MQHPLHTLSRALCLLLAGTGVSAAATIYPIDRAEMLAGSRFDLKLEFAQTLAPEAYTLRINGKPWNQVLKGTPRFIASEEVAAGSSGGSSVQFDGVRLTRPGNYHVEVQAPNGETASVDWTVYAAGKPKAKNVILFIGDGMTIANRTAARILSKGIKEGKYLGHLSFDDFPNMALIGTSGQDAIATDSANSMSAYTTGHKSGVNALGVYVSRAKDSNAHPKVETIGELVKRSTRKSLGIVSDAEIEDATPAGMLVHTRSRSDYATIVDTFLNSGVDVLLGGGRASFVPADALPESSSYKRRGDARNVIDEFKAKGYVEAETAQQLARLASDPQTRKLLGLFNDGNLDGALDRHVLKGGTVAQYPDQPDLTQMTRDALRVLSRNPQGFVLMVEAGLIDKASHRLDGERSVYDTIMLSNAVQVAVDWSAQRRDTLILVTPDHTHPMSLIGTIDENKGADEGRDQVMTYAKARFPTYPPADAEGYPDTVLASRHLAIVYGAFPDYYETFMPKLDGPNEPTIKDPAAPSNYIANPKYRTGTRSELRPGNLPHSEGSGVHAVDDGLLHAYGPGAHAVHGFMDNTQVFRVMVEALGLRPRD